MGSAQRDDDGTEGSDAQGDAATQGDAAADSTEGDSAADGETPQVDPATDGETDGEADGAEAEQEPKETVVEVSVARGSVSWVEITCDGESIIADSVTGPWSESYTVHDSITVQVANPDAVTVTENGEKVDFSSHAGGLGSLTIEGTPLPEEGAEEAPAEEAE